MPNIALISALRQMALLGFLPATLCRGMIRTHSRIAADWDLWRMLYRLSFPAAAGVKKLKSLSYNKYLFEPKKSLKHSNGHSWIFVTIKKINRCRNDNQKNGRRRQTTKLETQTHLNASKMRQSVLAWTGCRASRSSGGRPEVTQGWRKGDAKLWELILRVFA